MRSLPRQLVIRTDIVGYPIHSDYNIELVTSVYFLIVIVFPLLSLLLYVGLGEVSRMLGLRTSSSTQPSPSTERGRDPLQGTGRGFLAGAARVLVVGVAFGLEVAVARNATMESFWVTIAFVSLTYAGVVFDLAFGLQMTVLRNRTPLTLAAALNALATPIVVIGLVAVSAASSITVTADGSVHRYSWLPIWVALAATALLLLWVAARVARAPNDAIFRAERAVILFVVTPVFLFVVMSVLPGALGPINMYEDGQNLVGAQLTLQGHVPWRDALPDHGLLQDQLSSIPGFVLFGNSFWGATAGRTLLLTPLTFVFLFVFFAVVFERSWAALAAFVAVMLGGVLSTVHPGGATSFPLLTPTVDTRFMFWPLVLVLMKLALDSASPWPTAFLGAVLVAWAVLVPESVYGLAAIGTVFVLRDLRLRGQGGSQAAAFSRTLCLMGGGVALAIVVLAYLMAEGALQGFVQYYVNNALGHELVGGLPVDPRSWLRDPYFAIAAISPVVATLLTFWYLAAALLRGRKLLTLDWVMAAAGILTLLYYTKFLARADLHVLYAYAVAVPLIGLLLFQVWHAVEHSLAGMRFGVWLTRRVTLQPIALLLLIAALFGTGRTLLDHLPLVPTQVRAQAPQEPTMGRIGYSTATPDLGTHADVDAVLRAYLRPGDWVFDFSNDPTFYYYLLEREPRTKYSSVAWAISEAAQKDLISELKRHRPKLVVFTSDRYGLTEWDGIPNMVRHYDVSQYILDNYRPLLSIRGQILYADASFALSSTPAEGLNLGEAPVTEDLPFRGFPCDWGAAPNFLTVSPPSRERELRPVTLTAQMSRTGSATVSGWAVDSTPGVPMREVVIVSGNRVIARGPTIVDRPDVAAARHDPQQARSGFQIAIPGVPANEPPQTRGLRVFGVSGSGVASELQYGPSVVSQFTRHESKGRLDLGDGTTTPVRPGAVDGFVDRVTTSYPIQITAPSIATWADYRWLEIDAGDSGIRPDMWTISDQLVSSPQRQVMFQTLRGSPKTFKVYIGSCSQWHGYASASLYMTHQQSQEIKAIRLLP